MLSKGIVMAMASPDIRRWFLYSFNLHDLCLADNSAMDNLKHTNQKTATKTGSQISGQCFAVFLTEFSQF